MLSIAFEPTEHNTNLKYYYENYPPACKQLIVNALHWIVEPITCQPAFFLLLFILLTIPDIYYLAFHSFLPISRSLLGFFLVYILSLPVIFLPSLFRKYYKVVLVLFAMLFFIVDVYLFLLYNETLGTISKDTIAAVLATNLAEAAEFINVYLAVDNILIVSVSISAVFLLFYYLRNIRLKWNNIGRSVVLMLLLFSILTTLMHFDRIKDCNIYYLLTEKCPNLCEYRQNPVVECSGEVVENVVLVIGESFSKYHSSLYGYDKDTNPLLEDLKNDSALFVYNNVTSACVTTIPAIKSIMMSYTDSMRDSIEWYKCLTLLEVMQKAGYRTYWLSNQSKTGIYDNEVGRFADLCDEQVFIGNKYSGFDRTDKDEELLPVIEEILPDVSLPRFIIVQLMGSHADYSKRYPLDFRNFTQNDYVNSHSNFSSYNRDVLAEYDNSVLYNDYVVHKLMGKFSRETAVVLYFSDHGEDVFRSSADICTHGTDFDDRHKYIVMQIPFMVYTSPLFRERHPELQRRIENAVSRPYRTDSIMYTIMDIAGVETVNGISYKHKSLFK